MPPLRRYLRITKYTVLEVRIHLEDPAQLTWLLRGANPALPRIFKAIRPLVLPKLREENERAKGKPQAKKRGVKDALVQDDFEVSVFLTDSSTRHQLLTKSKSFAKTKSKGSISDWVQRSGDAQPTTSANEGTTDTIVIREESPDDVRLSDISIVDSNASDAAKSDSNSHIGETRGAADDKKIAPKVTYDGFSIYNKTLCLIIKKQSAASALAKLGSSSQMMESWVSTQAAQGEPDH